MAKVDVELSLTVNLSNFESVRLGMRVSDVEAPSASKEDIEATRKAITDQLLSGNSNGVYEVKGYMTKELSSRINDLKKVVKASRQEG